MHTENRSPMEKKLEKGQESPLKAEAKSSNTAPIPGCYTTLNELIDSCTEKFGTHPAIGMAFEEPLTYNDFHSRILALAWQLQDEGVSHGDHVALLAENSHNWGTAYLAIVRLGAVAVPILPDLPESDVRHIITEMKSSLIFITEKQIEKIFDIKDTLTKIITLDNFVEKKGLVDVQTFSEFLQDAVEKYDQAEDITFPAVHSNDLASILYTSGTSGFSKAVMLTHYNLCTNGFASSKLFAIHPGSTFLSVLPISHTYEFTVGFLLPLIKGCRIVYAGKTPTPAILQKICAEERPEAMLVVPLIMEKIFKKRVLPAIEKSKLLTLACRFKLGRKLIYKTIGAKLLTFFGGNLTIMGIGGAALNPTVESFLRDAGFPYLIGYGLTETAPLLAGGPQNDKTIALGSCGKPVPYVDIKIDNPDPETAIGEIIARGPNVMQGYWNDKEATNETFTEDGWIRTGDLGIIDKNGNLHIKGRSKSVIVLASGENIYPEAIEHKLNAYPSVVESIVLENNGLLEAWIYPDYEYIDAETVGQSRLQRHEYISAELDKMRTEVNEQLAITSRLSRIIERREAFIKTATHKIKRYLYSNRHTGE